MWNSLDACSRRPSLLVVRTLTEALTVLTWKVQVCMRCRYASELGLHVEVGPLIIATLVSPCALAALSHPTPPLRLYHFAAAKYNVHISKRGLVPVSPGLGQISTRNTSVKMCWNTSLPRRIANEDAHVARVPFFFFFFFDPGHFSIFALSYLFRWCEITITRSSDFSIFQFRNVEYFFNLDFSN